MASTLERRNEQPERVPLRMAVELGHGDFRDPFEASVCNVSKGGISMRATCLPDVGSELMCRFRCMPSNTLVTVQGEIVWAHLDGDNCGEFGLAFVDLDPKAEWLIEEMIAEHVALVRDSEAAAPVATLELEGSQAPIEARLSHQSGGRAVFEQQLELLSLGRGVRAHTDGRALLAGSIASVELRMVGAVPMLTVTVAFDRGAEVEVGGQIALPVHDTEPDLIAPDEHPSHVAHAGVMDAAEIELNFGVAEELAAEPTRAPMHLAAPSAKAPAAVLPPAPRAESNSVAFKTTTSAADDDDAAFEAELRASVWKPLLIAFLTRARAVATAIGTLMRPRLIAASHAALPVLRGGALRAGSRARGFYRAQVAPQLGAARRVVAAQLLGRRRRVTAGPAGNPQRPQGAQSTQQRAQGAPVARMLVLGALAASAVGLAVYAFVPTSADDAVTSHRKVRKHAREHAQTEAAQPTAEGATPEAAPVAAEPAPADGAKANTNAGVASAGVASAANAAAAKSPATAAAATKAAASAAPAAVAATPAAAAASAATKTQAPRKMRFGAARVPGGRQFALRMSAPIQSIDGLADRGGFTVVVHGCLSLDRAGPIGSAHRSVSRAMVINKGDHAELSVRFGDGKQPAYQVSADGATLYITIQDA